MLVKSVTIKIYLHSAHFFFSFLHQSLEHRSHTLDRDFKLSESIMSIIHFATTFYEVWNSLQCKANQQKLPSLEVTVSSEDFR